MVECTCEWLIHDGDVVCGIIDEDCPGHGTSRDEVQEATC